MPQNEQQRSYGQGAQGETSAPKLKKTSAWTRLKYRFDNSIASSGSFVGFLAVGSIAFALIATGLRFVSEGDLPEGATFWDRFWGTIAMLFLGAGRPDANWLQRIVAILLWLAALTFTATIIGFIGAKINAGIAALKKGRSPIIDSNHTLILGWSNRVFPLLKELAVANENAHKPLVVIFADVDREQMEDEIAARAGKLGRLRVVTRRGDATNPEDLKRANVSAAKSVIILDSDESGDATVVSTVLAVKSVNANPSLKIIAELDDANTADALATATKGQVLAVRSHDVIARVTAQASRQPGLAAVMLDLLDFDGDEIYFTQVPALAGKTYSEAIMAFNQASVIGLVQGGATLLNPSHKTVIKADAKIIAIAKDDDRIVYTGIRDDITVKASSSAAKAASPEHLLVIGWSSMGRSVLNELAGFLPKGSTVHIVAQKRYVAADEFANLKFGNVKVTTAAVGGDIDELIAAASAKRYDEIIVLGYRNAISEAEADAQTMLTMLQLNQMFADDGNGVEATRLVAEILDSRKAELARVAATGDLVISDNLAALLIAQVSENPALSAVFDDLFDPAGAAVNVRPIELYAKPGQELEYAQLVAAARKRGESAIGYRHADSKTTDGSTGVVLNPDKNSLLTIGAGDSLVVVSDI